jgi:hypothetical protein
MNMTVSQPEGSCAKLPGDIQEQHALAKAAGSRIFVRIVRTDQRIASR